jgi:hypothetical protein
MDLKRRNETSKYMKLLLNIIYKLIYVIRLVCHRREVSEISGDQKTNVSKRIEVLDKLLMSTRLEKEKHNTKFATCMNVIVSQR